ncbi:uncharacterized protein B0J16DRAFT_322650 [Fusarium flagelliforme]|uniref:uncharacterized protein n=1 Tax=Fusarium flagelliforme TaxID=2675880 RepID=UPI001E8D71DF|nr:uncharacterized protein B0J16DRAFT_322650 [Fusarium flagelliforme]KAH7179160.1 hypothetical protein B0J16DRAFT_322650 [Fusarium flagelliforme]
MTPSQKSTNTEYGLLFKKPPEQQGERSPVAPLRLDDLRAERQDNPASGGADVPLPPRPETRLLEMFRDKILLVLGADTEDGDVPVDLFITWPLPFSWDNNNKTVHLEPNTERPSETGIALARPVIREAWPQNYNVHGVCQFIVGSDGNVPATEVPWDIVEQTYRPGNSGPLLTYSNNDSKSFRYALEDLWHRWCLEAHQGMTQDCHDTVASRIKYRGKIVYCSLGSCRKGVRRVSLGAFATALSNDAPFSILGSEILQADVGWSARLFYPRFRSQCIVLPEAFEMSSIHWQIRYIRPAFNARGYRGIETNFFLSERERTNIRVGAEGTLLEERRAWITLRVKKTNLFHILILSDESFDPRSEDTHHLNSKRQAGRSWSRYGFKAAENTVPVCHFLLEVCRIFEEAMDAWERTLNVIDELIHVNLSDLDDPARVEDLMFDKSFNRSKDYLVALQILRIVDEWIDEVLPSMEVLRENAQLEQDGFYQPGVSESIDAADKWIKQQAGSVQRRVRKKTEEIKSLRDGLFNATALREATKAAKLNQATYIFTIVTLVFTPLGFLAVCTLVIAESQSEADKTDYVGITVFE